MPPLSDLRLDYRRHALDESEADPDPIRQFQVWFEDATAAQLPEPNVMALATATATGVPSVRMVLLKGFDARGFVFFTNYESRKGNELGANPAAALAIYWAALERQIRIEGLAFRIPREESEAYFRSRPETSRLGAWASRQSVPISSRAALDEGYEAVKARFEGAEIPLPPFWGGYRLSPESIEFWQGRPNRLHDRLLYTRPGGLWRMERLAP